MNKSFPLIDVHVHKKFGWKVSILASLFSLAASLSYIIVFLTLKIKTHEDLGNLTNKGKEYQIDHQREAVTRWNWFLPITLCFIACGFGVLAGVGGGRVRVGFKGPTIGTRSQE